MESQLAASPTLEIDERQRKPPTQAELGERIARFGARMRTTPLVQLELEDGPVLFAKLESVNPTGSAKDRTAYGIMEAAIRRGEVTPDSVIVESSSGNLAVALAVLCRHLGLSFVPVIDPNVPRTSERLLTTLCARVVKVQNRDPGGGYLVTRLQMVHEICAQNRNAFWTRQYENRDGMMAHYTLTAGEICAQVDRIDHAFIPVSSGGTVAGVSRRLKEHFPNVKIVAVDAEGSIIFGKPPRTRRIPGIGSSIVPQLIQEALIDDVVWVSEAETVRGCLELLDAHGLFVGGSSGSAYAGARRYLATSTAASGARAVFICPDHGSSYVDTIYSPTWPAEPSPA